MLQHKIHDAALLTPAFFFFFAVHSTFITETNIISTLALSHQYMQPSWHLLFCLSHVQVTVTSNLVKIESWFTKSVGSFITAD